MSSRHVRGPLVFNDWTKKTTAGNVTVANEAVVIIKKASGQATAVVLPAPSATGGRRLVYVVDGKGDANSNNITVTVAGSGTINGGASDVISTNYGKMGYIDVGDEWVKFS